MQVRMPSTASRLLTVVLAALLVVGGGFCGYLIFSTTRDVVVHAQFELPAPPEIVPIQLQAKEAEEASSRPEGEKRQSPLTAALSQPQVGRVNILMVGLDVPDSGVETARADTIIVVSIDPAGGPVSMLSIPRDLWVPVGPYGENRINTAYFLGEVRDYPGGGPGLLRATVEQHLGIPIHYHICADFNGFCDLIDQLGGVMIEVEEDIYDPTFPDGQGGVKTVFIPAGTRRMGSEKALQYARSRHATDDLGRALRQQHLLMAIRDEVLSRESIGDLLPKLSALYHTLSQTVQTDLSLEDLVRLAGIASRIDVNDVEAAVIDHTMTTRYITDRGWDVLLPIPEKIAPVLERLFCPSVATIASEPQYGLEPSPEVAAEDASILLLDGSGKAGLAEAAAEYLRAQGFRIVSHRDLERGDYSSTVMVVYSDKPGTVAALSSALRLRSDNIRLAAGSPNPEGVDIKVILGQDFALPAD